jgi:hypothetical protein
LKPVDTVTNNTKRNPWRVLAIEKAADSNDQSKKETSTDILKFEDTIILKEYEF